MFLSIVIPVYNVEKYLKECLDSVLCQLPVPGEEVEILLIDDGSTDASGRICDDYERQCDGLLRVYHKENEGLLLTRRYGFSKATGRYIMNIDSDDFIEENALGIIVRAAVLNDPDMILYNHFSYQNGIRRRVTEHLFGASSGNVEKEQVIDLFVSGNVINGLCMKVFKRECLDLTLDYSGYSSYGEDSLQTIELLKKAEKFYYIDEALYIYRSASGMTSRFNPDYYVNYKPLFEKMQRTEELHGIGMFDQKMAARYFSMAGRAVTQSRWAVPFAYKRIRAFLVDIRQDEMFKDMVRFYGSIRSELQMSHRIVLWLENRKLYLVLYIFLFIKNMLP